MRSILALGVFVLSALPFLASAQTGTPCHVYQSGSVPPAGYAASWNVLSSARELLLTATCNGTAVTQKIGSGASNQYVYKGYYYFSQASQRWTSQTATGTFVEGSSDWLLGQGTVPGTAQLHQLFWVGYVCQWNGTAWKCGCRDQACATSYWNLQAVQAQGGGTTAGGTTGAVSGGGISDQFPGDIGIDTHPSVIFHETFESGSLAKWSDKWTGPAGQFVFSSSNVHTGTRSLEAVIGQRNGEAGGHLGNRFGKAYDRLYMRWYAKYDPGWDTGPRKGSHAGGSMRGCNGACDPAGVPANGTNKVSASFEPGQLDGSEVPPGRFYWYVYHMDAPGSYGQIFRPDSSKAAAATIGTNKWYAIEMMLKMNTVGQTNGELKGWVNGVLVMHKTGLRFRSTNSLVMDTIRLGSYIHDNPVRTNRIWWDDVVVATEYIGPMAR